MRTSSKTKVKGTQTAVLIAAGLGLAAISAAAVLTLNPRYRQYLTRPFFPYKILPGYVVPGYVIPGTPGYTIPGYIPPGYRPRR